MSKVGLMHKVAALLPILLVTAFSSSPLSASPVFLGTAQLSGDTLAKTCFDTDCTTREVTNGNASTVSPDSAAKTTTVPSRISSISARSESDILPAGGGSAPASFTSIAKAEASINYFFAIEGPQNIPVELLVTATGNIAVTGNFASTGYLDYVSEARLITPVAPTQDIFFDTSGSNGQNKVQTISNSFSINGTFDLDSNTGYQILMQVSTGTGLNEQTGSTALADLVATASIDPSFQIISPLSGYSIVFSDGIVAPTATPLPGTLTLFAGGLVFVGYLTRRKRSAKQAVAAS
jgi:hypothetical protein